MTISQSGLTFDETSIQNILLYNQAVRLAENYKQTSNLEVLNQAIRIMEQGINIGEYI